MMNQETILEVPYGAKRQSQNGLQSFKLARANMTRHAMLEVAHGAIDWQSQNGLQSFKLARATVTRRKRKTRTAKHSVTRSYFTQSLVFMLCFASCIAQSSDLVEKRLRHLTGRRRLTPGLYDDEESLTVSDPEYIIPRGVPHRVNTPTQESDDLTVPSNGSNERLDPYSDKYHNIIQTALGLFPIPGMLFSGCELYHVVQAVQQAVRQAKETVQIPVYLYILLGIFFASFVVSLYVCKHNEMPVAPLLIRAAVVTVTSGAIVGFGSMCLVDHLTIPLVDMSKQDTHAMASSPWMFFGLISGGLVLILALLAFEHCKTTISWGSKSCEYSVRLAGPVAAILGMGVLGVGGWTLTTDLFPAAVQHTFTPDAFSISVFAVGGVLLVAGVCIAYCKPPEMIENNVHKFGC